MKSIVTGGAGFIGSHIVDKLIELGHEVIVIDNESSEVHDNFWYNDKAKYFKYDIADYGLTRPLYDGIDYVFHCAAESRIQPAIENPLLAVRTNTLGTATVLQCSRESGVKRVMYSSTSSAYGRVNNPPLRENMPDDCLNPYSVSKVSGEKLCKMYSELFGLETVVFRYFNVYGPREPLKGPYAPVVGLFLRQKANGEPLTVVGDGLQRRDFTHVYDVVNANILAMKLANDVQFFIQSAPGAVYNVGTGINYSVIELARMISDVVKFIPERIGESRETLANIEKIVNVFNWEPTKRIEDYIRERL
jgi:UDP-glucose 4-epimerase